LADIGCGAFKTVRNVALDTFCQKVGVPALTGGTSVVGRTFQAFRNVALNAFCEEVGVPTLTGGTSVVGRT